MFRTVVGEVGNYFSVLLNLLAFHLMHGFLMLTITLLPSVRVERVGSFF